MNSGTVYVCPERGIECSRYEKHWCESCPKHANGLPPETTQSASLAFASSAAGRDVLAERQRQVSAEGWTPEHDDKYQSGELVRAAAAYALQSPDFWPWPMPWWKPTDYRRNLVKAAALLIAEIERSDRRAVNDAGNQTEGAR